jgi:hypothetical protein
MNNKRPAWSKLYQFRDKNCYCSTGRRSSPILEIIVEVLGIALFTWVVDKTWRYELEFWAIHLASNPPCFYVMKMTYTMSSEVYSITSSETRLRGLSLGSFSTAPTSGWPAWLLPSYAISCPTGTGRHTASRLIGEIDGFLYSVALRIFRWYKRNTTDSWIKLSEQCSATWRIA